MTRTQAKAKVLEVFRTVPAAGSSDDAVVDKILLALDGALVLEPEIRQFSGRAVANATAVQAGGKPRG